MSVIIPAHEAERTLRRTLRTLVEEAAPGELDVVVVCNGCTDGTVDVARAFGPAVRTVVLAEAGKSRALNVGDRIARRPVRVYLDADVEVDVMTVRSLCRALERPGIEAAAPSLHVDVTGSSWPVRAYLRVWQRLPGVRQGVAGRGVFALSAEGRVRLGSFPEDVLNDDGFVNALFADASVTVEARRSTVRAPATTRELLRRRARVHFGNVQLDQKDGLPGRRSHGVADVARLCADEPSIAPAALTFLAVSALTRLHTIVSIRRGDPPAWGNAAP